MANWMTRIFSQPGNQSPNGATPGGAEPAGGRRALQIKEVLRLGHALRAELELETLLSQMVETITHAMGFRRAVLHLAHDDQPELECAAFAGISLADQMRLRATPPTFSRMLAIMRPEFRMSQSYFIPHEHAYLLQGLEVVKSETPRQEGRSWHPEDALFIPLVSPRENKLLGVLSLDDPEDGQRPTLETIEIIELFANQAALAIDNARLFQQREDERRAMEAAISDLLREVEHARQGDLTARVQLSETSLSAVADSLNAMLRALNAVLLEVRRAVEVVSRSSADLQISAWRLAAGAQQQERQVSEISKTIQAMATSVQEVSDTAANATQVAHEALDITNDGREAAEQAVEGMKEVREMALQSARKIKHLGESTQEIGEIVQLISDFASKTNLLALNASIEAIRAGEHGRGFSAVAQEIRNLANHSADAAKQVAAKIKNIQNETNAVVVSIEHNTQQVVIQSELASHAGEALQAVDTVMQRIVQHIEGISSAAAQQASAANLVARSMGDISQITFYTTRNINQMHLAMAQLTELAESLQRRIALFQLAEEELVDAEQAHSLNDPVTQPKLVARRTSQELRTVPLEEYPSAEE